MKGALTGWFERLKPSSWKFYITPVKPAVVVFTRDSFLCLFFSIFVSVLTAEAPKMSKVSKLFKGSSSSSSSSKAKHHHRSKGGPSAQEAIHRLRETEEMLTKKQEYLEKKIEQEIATAKKHGTKNKRGMWQ